MVKWPLPKNLGALWVPGKVAAKATQPLEWAKENDSGIKKRAPPETNKPAVRFSREKPDQEHPGKIEEQKKNLTKKRNPGPESPNGHTPREKTPRQPNKGSLVRGKNFQLLGAGPWVKTTSPRYSPGLRKEGRKNEQIKKKSL